MRKSKYDKKSKDYLLDVAEKHGLAEVRHAANKWCCAIKASLAKAGELEHRLEEVKP